MSTIFKSKLITPDKRVYEVSVWEEEYETAFSTSVEWIRNSSWIFSRSETIYSKKHVSKLEAVEHAESLVQAFPTNPIFSHAVNA